MDAISFLRDRQLEVDSIFSEELVTDVSHDLTSNLNILGFALEKQVRTWWDICTFEKYIKEKIIMRSLRWEVTPQDALDDETSTQEWLDFFNNVGIKLQELILKRKKLKMKILEKKIADLKIILDEDKDSPIVLKFNSDIKKKLQKIDKDTHKKKVKKYYRDLGDFKNNTIYLWQNPGSVPNQRAQNETELAANYSTNQLATPGPSTPRGPIRPSAGPPGVRAKTVHKPEGAPSHRDDQQSQHMGYGYQSAPRFDSPYRVPVHNRYEALNHYEGSQPPIPNPVRPFQWRGGRGRGGRWGGRPWRGRPQWWGPPQSQGPYNPQWRQQPGPQHALGDRASGGAEPDVKNKNKKRRRDGD